MWAKSRRDKGSFFSTIWWGLNSDVFGGGNGSRGAIGWHEGVGEEAREVQEENKGWRSRERDASSLMKEESGIKLSSFINGSRATGSRWPLIKRTGKKQRNYSSVIKLWETSPSRGPHLTAPTVEPLNSELPYFIKLDCLRLGLAVWACVFLWMSYNHHLLCSSSSPSSSS